MTAIPRDPAAFDALRADPSRFWHPSEFLPFLKVKPKEGALVPFSLWSHQEILAAFTWRAYAEGRWLCHVKPRQEGSSTFFAGVATQHAAFIPGTRVGIMAHKKEVAKQLVKIAIRFQQSIPDYEGKAKKAAGPKNFLRLRFDGRPDEDSEIVSASAQDDEPMRGETVQFLLATEVSSWSETGGPDAWTSALSAVAPNGFVIAESTPKHYGDELQGIWRESQEPGSRWLSVFIPWTRVEEYRSPPPPGWHPSPAVADYAHKHRLTPEQAHWMQTRGLDKVRRDFNKFRAEYPISEEDCWLQAGDTVYNSDALMAMREALDGGTGLTAFYGEREVFIPPVLGHRYVIFVDPASGLKKRDFFGIQVFDVDTFEQVAEYHGHRETYQIAKIVEDFCATYNSARIYVEANGVGETLITLLKHMGLLRCIYHRKPADGSKPVPGWWSNERYKHEAITALQELINDGSVIIRSVRLMRQLIAFRGERDQRDDSGGHFDLAMAAAGAAWALRHESKRKRPTVAPVVATDEIRAQATARFLVRLDRGAGDNSRWGRHT